MPKRHGNGKDARGAVRRIEELVVASSGADAFELVFALAAGRLAAKRGAGWPARRAVLASVRRAARAWPGLEVRAELDVSDEVLAEVTRLLEGALEGDEREGLDAVFEGLLSRVGKGDKGQFFTPRHVVDFVVHALAPARGERVVDPACGSGAFLAHARGYARVETWGADVDSRAVRLARLLAVATGEDPSARVRADALGDPAALPHDVDVIATNPPFAGDVSRPGFELARLVPRAERDALFLERCLSMLRPGGRLGIVLPYGKVSTPAWAPLRRWLTQRARVVAVVSLPRETFLPHTSQRAAVVFAHKRARPVPVPDPRERVFLAASERAGKDSAGEPMTRAGGPGVGWRGLDHDLGEVGARLARFFEREGLV